MWHVGEERGAYPTGFWWENPKERDNLEDLRVDGRIIIKNIYIFNFARLRHEKGRQVFSAEWQSVLHETNALFISPCPPAH